MGRSERDVNESCKSYRISVLVRISHARARSPILMIVVHTDLLGFALIYPLCSGLNAGAISWFHSQKNFPIVTIIVHKVIQCKTSMLKRTLCFGHATLLLALLQFSTLVSNYHSSIGQEWDFPVQKWWGIELCHFTLRVMSTWMSIIETIKTDR